MAYVFAMHPGNRLRLLRKRAKLTQGDVGDRTGLSQEAVSMFENGKRPLTLEHMRSIARAIGCSVADLLDDSDNPDRLDDAEREMIDAFRSAPDDARGFILTSAQAVSRKRVA